VLLHGTFNGDMAVKANGDPMTAIELAAVQANSQIYFVQKLLRRIYDGNKNIRPDQVFYT
jgi:hypothetical protein